MKIIVAPDSFKESLDAFKVANAIERGLKKANPRFSVKKLPLSDGGDGSFEVLTHYMKSQILQVSCLDPLLRKISAQIGISGDTAIIEMAKASGLDLLSDSEKDAMSSDSFGTGQLIKEALNTGVKKIIFCLGGTATMDAGHGILRALGFQFFDRSGKTLQPGGESLFNLESINLPHKLELLQNIEFEILSDVTNPFLGPEGAARVFAPQKGADPEQVKMIEKGFEKFSQKILEMTKYDIRSFQGGGAAGGVPAGLAPFLNVSIKSGAEKIIELSGFNDEILETDLVITAEGKLDDQTLNGKLPFVLAKKTSLRNKKIIFIGGQIPGKLTEENIALFDAVFSISPGPESLFDSILNASQWLERTAYNIGKLLS